MLQRFPGRRSFGEGGNDLPVAPRSFNVGGTISIALIRPFLAVSQIMRLLAEIVIIAALIFLGWNKPFKEQVAQASTTIESKLHRTGSTLQKHEDPSVRRY